MSPPDAQFAVIPTRPERYSDEEKIVLDGSGLEENRGLGVTYIEDESPSQSDIYKERKRRTRLLKLIVGLLLVLPAIFWGVVHGPTVLEDMSRSFRQSYESSPSDYYWDIFGGGPYPGVDAIPSDPIDDYMLVDIFADGPYPRVRAYTPRCPTVTHAKSEAFEYNVTDGSDPKRFLLQDSSPSEARSVLRGDITVTRGNIFQRSDIEVHVVANTNEKLDLANIVLRGGADSLEIDYFGYESKPGKCTELHIVISLRPWPKKTLDSFEIDSQILNIDIDNMLVWEIDDLVAHTSHGYFWMEDRPGTVDTLVAHNISISSTSGRIEGAIIPHENLAIHSETGSISVSLGSYSGNNRPKFDPKSISFSTVSGYVSIRTAYEVWPLQPYTHRTHVETVSGSVYATLPHGSYTNVSSTNGSITAYFRPFFADSEDATSEIYTSLEHGSLGAYIEDPTNQSPNKDFNPLVNTVSEHTVGTGSLRVRYGYSWYGKLEARTGAGKLDFDSTALEDVEKSEGHVKAKRGKDGKSCMNAHIDTGDLIMRIGL